MKRNCRFTIMLLMLFSMVIAGCSSDEIEGQPFGIQGYGEGKHAFFMFTSVH